ncbi:hypothetical protein [Rothia kristinae]
MTWAKYGAEFYAQMLDADFRSDLDDACQLTHGQVIHYLYMVESETMTIRKRVLPRVASSPKAMEAADELVRHGFWEDNGTSFTVVHHADVIRRSLADQARIREGNKVRQARRRAKESQAAAESSSGSAQGGAQKPVESVPEPEVTSWPVTPPGGVNVDTGEVEGVSSASEGDGGYCMTVGCMHEAWIGGKCAEHMDDRPLRAVEGGKVA